MADSTDQVVSIPTQQTDDTRSYYRSASTEEVYRVMERSLNDIVREAARQAIKYMGLARYNDKDQSCDVRYEHLVDATECLEIALSHLTHVRSAIHQQQRIEEGQTNTLPF